MQLRPRLTGASQDRTTCAAIAAGRLVPPNPAAALDLGERNACFVDLDGRILEILFVKMVHQIGVDNAADVTKPEDGLAELLLVVSFHANYHAPVGSGGVYLYAFHSSQDVLDGCQALRTRV